MLRPGTPVGEYVLARYVTSGATSDVHEGRHATRGTRVAVKVLLSERGLDAKVVARFLNEARTLQDLRHPHLIRGLDAGVLPEGRPYMVLEWRSEDFHQSLAREQGRLPLQDGLAVIRQLAEVLSWLHAQGLVHRDLKPANVLVARRAPGAWRVQLADLGLAKRLESPEDTSSYLPVSTAGDALLGTGDYRAPEQWTRPKSVTGQADVYSLGILAFQVFTGRLPFIARAQQNLGFLHVVEKPPLELLDGVLPASPRELLGQMLLKKPAERPTMAQVLARWPRD